MNATQLRLPDAPHNGTPTSRIAASMVNVSHQERMVLAVLREGLKDRHAGLTQDQIAERTGLLRSAVAGRCNRLEFKGLIKKDGTRVTKYGRPAAVYVLAAAPYADGDGGGPRLPAVANQATAPDGTPTAMRRLGDAGPPAASKPGGFGA